ncbi:MAG: dephospho-CoA kinase [Candidatus Omnitrophica bacterium]|nr:dephospho-CoA kinase [Candidatus Omnitrophota bacterium]
MRRNRRYKGIVIGVTGGMGTGKTTVSKMLAEISGAKVLDADSIAHRYLKRGTRTYRDIVTLFGKDILVKGKISRRLLSKKVFSSGCLLRILQAIVHPEVIEFIDRELTRTKRRTYPAVIIDAPLLIEASLHKVVDYVIVVVASRKNQLARSKRRGSISRSEIVRRTKMQIPLSKKKKLADFIIDNNGSRSNAKKEVKKIWRDMCLRKK